MESEEEEDVVWETGLRWRTPAPAWVVLVTWLKGKGKVCS